MKEKTIKTKQTALQERIAQMMRDFYEQDNESAVMACFQEGQSLNFIIQGSMENLATAFHSMLRTNDDFYKMVIDVAGSELASRVADIGNRKLAQVKEVKPKS